MFVGRKDMHPLRKAKGIFISKQRKRYTVHTAYNMFYSAKRMNYWVSNTYIKSRSLSQVSTEFESPVIYSSSDDHMRLDSILEITAWLLGITGGDLFVEKISAPMVISCHSR
jgi:hypothetical protein